MGADVVEVARACVHAKITGIAASHVAHYVDGAFTMPSPAALLLSTGPGALFWGKGAFALAGDVANRR